MNMAKKARAAMLGRLAMPVTLVSVPVSHSADIRFSNQTGGNPKQVALPGQTHSIAISNYEEIIRFYVQLLGNSNIVR
jgi:hypothetical protein